MFSTPQGQRQSRPQAAAPRGAWAHLSSVHRVPACSHFISLNTISLQIRSDHGRSDHGRSDHRRSDLRSSDHRRPDHMSYDQLSAPRQPVERARGKKASNQSVAGSARLCSSAFSAAYPHPAFRQGGVGVWAGPSHTRRSDREGMGCGQGLSTPGVQIGRGWGVGKACPRWCSDMERSGLWAVRGYVNGVYAVYTRCIRSLTTCHSVQYDERQVCSQC